MSQIGQLIAAPFAEKAQNNANNQAQDTQRQYLSKLLAFQKQVYGDTQPFRDIALQYGQSGQELQGQVLPGLLDYINNPTASPQYQLYAQEGLKQLRQNAATGGGPNAGASQISQGRFMSGLSADQLDKINALRQGLLNYSGNAQVGAGQQYSAGINTASNVLAAAGKPVGDIAGLQQTLGAIKAGYYNQLGAGIGSLVGQGATMASGGFGGMSSGSSAWTPGPSASFGTNY